jgi:uncharacterized protein (DUF1697 family)
MAKAIKNNIRYVAFLRGVNVGGHTVIAMADLKKIFEKMGFTDVRTILASGNVMFESGESGRDELTAMIQAGLRKEFARDMGVIVRAMDDIVEWKAMDPFQGVRMTPDIRLYVTFLPDGAPRPAKSALPASPDGAFRVVKVDAGEVFSVVDLSMGKGTPEAMAMLEKEYGSGVTTRNWNTVLKLLA